MPETVKKKTWIIQDGVLKYETDEGLQSPSADELYSAVFEGNYSNRVTKLDTDALVSKVNFSPYPAALKIVLESDDTGAIQLRAYALSVTGKRAAIPKNEDHVIVENTWYPFAPGAKAEVLEVMTARNITAVGKISLGQYLSILKSPTDDIINEVVPEKIRVPEKYTNESPSGLTAKLYPYQTKGWQWLRFMSDEKIGGILADEMGLGKTLQVIALISSALQTNNGPSLIICPATLLENWRREFEKFTPKLTKHIHQGPNRTGFPNDLKQFDVVITSYDTIVRDSSLFNQINWRYAICDEAQAIKNPATKRAISIKRIPRQTGFAVTGTPIENSLTDLWSIMDFSIPRFLESQEVFESKYSNSADGAARLESLISPLILRRTVAEVASDLPSKIIIPQILELTSREAEQYEKIREETAKEFESNSSLVVLTRLRMFCTHPFLISDLPGEDPALHSNKYKRFVEIIEEVVANHAKVLVFTSYNRMNDLIAIDLVKRFKVFSGSIDGRTKVEDRQKIIDAFSQIQGSAVLVLNPIAAGAGLNITAANHVVHYNLEWNPAKEDQASARAYRRGQDRPVTIHRLFYAGTVEEAIDERLTRKREIAGTAIVGVQGDESDYQDIFNALNKSPHVKL